MCVKFLLFCFFFEFPYAARRLVTSSSVKYLFFVVCFIFWSELWGIVVFENQRRSIIFHFTMIELLQTVPDQRSGSFRNLLLLQSSHLLRLLLLHHSQYGSPFGTDSPTTAAAAAAVKSRPLPVRPWPAPPTSSSSSSWAPGSAPSRTRPGRHRWSTRRRKWFLELTLEPSWSWSWRWN